MEYEYKLLRQFTMTVGAAYGLNRAIATHHRASLEPRLSVPDFVSQLWRKIGGRAWKDFSRDTVAP